MEIVCYPISFHRWKAELWSDGSLYAEAVGQRPGCAIRDAINTFCLKYDGMPEKSIRLTAIEWE